MARQTLVVYPLTEFVTGLAAKLLTKFKTEVKTTVETKVVAGSTVLAKPALQSLFL